MENSIHYLLKEIYLKIPSEILKETFKPQDKSLDAVIKEDVIVDIVLRRCNLYSGKIAKIQLKSEYFKRLESTGIQFAPSSVFVYVIPPEAREHRDISHTISLAYPFNYLPPMAYNYGVASQPQNVCSTINRVLGSNVGYPDIPVMPVPILLKNNVIKLEPNFETYTEYILACLLKYDSNFTNISPNSLRYLSSLGVLATKSLVYNRLIIPIGNAYLMGGQELGKFKEIVESYQDAEEKFEEALLKFRGSTTFDKDNLLSMVSLMM